MHPVTLIAMESGAPQISIDILNYIVDWLEANGTCTGPILEAAGIGRTVLISRVPFIDLAKYVHFFELAAECSASPNLGLHAARFKDPGSLSALGYLFMSAPTLLDAVRYVSNHLKALQGGTVHRVIAAQGSVRVEYRIIDDGIVHRRQDAEYSIAAIDNLIKIYSDGKVRPQEVHFEHSLTGRYGNYWTHFGCETFFEQESNAIIYALDGFEMRSPLRQGMLTNIIANHLETLARARTGQYSTSDQVRELIVAGLHSETQIADRLAISVSTLARRLKAEEKPFRHLLAEHRISNAKRMLATSDRTIADVALAVGYSESASFIRAFQQRVGLSPSQYREASAHD
jgi:AraC-like DNA-binding protein